MKLTKKQKKEIIESAKVILCTTGIDFGLCYALCQSIIKVLDIFVLYDELTSYFPKFKREIAIKHFKAKEGVWYWWPIEDKNNRLVFLQYLLDGKLPKRGKRRES
jgi:hypothetical protein